MADLSPRQRQHLKGLAHHLKPVVQIGKEGLSTALIKQVDDALEHHELIKVKLAENVDRWEISDALPGQVNAFLVQTIGKIVVLYRPHPEKPKIALPWPQAEAESQEEPPEPRDLDEARRPIARKPGGLVGGSVRERGPTRR